MENPPVNLQNLCTVKGIDEEHFLFYCPFVLSNSILDFCFVHKWDLIGVVWS